MVGVDGRADNFESAFATLRIRVETACAAERQWPDQVAAAIRAALAFAAAVPASAQALTNGAMARGGPGFADYDRMIQHFAAGLLPGRAQRPEGECLPEITERAMVGGLTTLIAQRLDLGRHAELPTIAPEAIQFVLTPYVGAERAWQATAGTAAESI